VPDFVPKVKTGCFQSVSCIKARKINSRQPKIILQLDCWKCAYFVIFVYNNKRGITLHEVCFSEEQVVADPLPQSRRQAPEDDGNQWVAAGQAEDHLAIRTHFHWNEFQPAQKEQEAVMDNPVCLGDDSI